MPLNHAALQLRVEQNTNDIAAIYEILEGIGLKLDAHDERFDAIDLRFDGINGRLDGLTAQMTEVLGILRTGIRPAGP